MELEERSMSGDGIALEGLAADVLSVNIENPTPAGFDRLAGLAHLKRLWIYVPYKKPPLFGRKDLAKLAGLKELEELQLVNVSTLADDWFEDLAPLPGLASLSVNAGDAFTGAGVVHLKSLRKVNLSRFTVDGLRAAAAAPLVEVHLYHEEAKVEQLQALAACKTIRWIQFLGKDFGDAGCDVLAGFPELEEAWLPRGASPEGLRKLTACRKLRKIHFEDTPLTAAHLAGLSAFPQLQVLGIHSGVDYDSKGIPSFLGFKQLEEIEIYGVPSKEVAADWAKLPSLRKLQLWGIGMVSVEALRELSSSASLKELVIISLSVPDEGLALMTSIKSLVLADCKGLTGSGLDPLKNVESLSLQSSSLTDGILAHVATMSSLRSLELIQNNFGTGKPTAAGIAVIGKLSGLKEIKFKADQEALRKQAPPALWKALPDCDFK
jgi:hypothetical protein